MSDAAPPRRIVVAVDDAAGARAAIEVAADLARRLSAEVTALFIEDEDLVRLAGLPFALEIGADAEGRPFDAGRLERRFRTTLREVRAACEEAAERARLRIRVESARGVVVREILAASEAAEMIVLGRGAGGLTRGAVARSTEPPSPRRGRGLGRTARSVLSSSRGTVAVVAGDAAVGRPVAVVLDGSESSRRALELALRLAGEDHRNLVALIAAEPSRAASLEAEAAALARGRGIVPRCIVLGSAPGAIARAVSEQRCRSLVVGRDCGVAREAGVADLVAALDLPVFVVG